MGYFGEKRMKKKILLINPVVMGIDIILKKLITKQKKLTFI